MRFASGAFILIQIILTFVSVKVEGMFFYQTRRHQQKHQGDTSGIQFSHPSNRKKVALMCRNTYYLVMENGKLKGSKDPKIVRKHGKFQLQSFGVGIMKIYNMREKKYIAFDKRGRAYATRSNTLDSLFKVTQRNSLFVTYHSLVHRTLANTERRKWYLAINGKGHFKRPTRTFSRHRRSIEFLPRDWTKYKLQVIKPLKRKQPYYKQR